MLYFDIYYFDIYIDLILNIKFYFLPILDIRQINIKNDFELL